MTHAAVPIENIKELRSGADARYYRELFQLSQDYESRWLTIVYVLDGGYKTLHLIAPTKDVFQIWDITLRKLYDIRQQLMSGLGSVEMRQTVWEKQFWAGADEGADQKLNFEDVEKLCRRLNINPSREDLLRRFKVRVYIPFHLIISPHFPVRVGGLADERVLIVSIMTTCDNGLTHLGFCVYADSGYAEPRIS